MSADAKDAAADSALLPLLPDLSAAAAAYAALGGPMQSMLGPLGTLTDAHAAIVRQMLGAATATPPSSPLQADRRFDDPAWQANPAYRALGESYFTWGRQVHSAIDTLPLKERQPEQWHAAADLLIDSLAPTNSLVGNPAALRRAFETGGASLMAGWTQWLQDMVRHQGMPASVDATGFEVGKNLAATPGQVVLRHEMFELIQYRADGGQVHQAPFLYVPPQINRYYMIDLAPGRSFVEYVVQQGFQPFVMSWRNPGPEHRDWGMDAFVAVILEAIEAVCEITGSESLNLAGSCTGGITAACAAALLGARGKQRLRSLTLMVAMLDTSMPTAFNLHSSPQSVALTKQMVRARGVLDGREMASVFAWMRPNEMVWNNWVNNVLMGRKPPSFDMLVWNQDTTRLPAQFHADLLDLGTQNFLMQPGARQMLGQALDLSAVDVPLYVIGGLTDHIAPWQSCYAALHAMRGEGEFVLGNGGHIQSIIAPPGGRKGGYYTRAGEAPPEAADWLQGATLNEGSWWPHWRDWLGRHSDKRVAPPRRAGNRRYPPLGDAPGTYVFGR